MSTYSTGSLGAETMSLLWLRMRQRGDLPGFSKAIRAIINAMCGDDDREFNMTKTVLSDPALTQKVLRLANSPMYSVFGLGINTVSKAVIVLGTEAIGHLALGLKLIDGLSSVSAESESARKEMEKAVLAGHIARQVASAACTRDAEEAVVCAMLHTLGRMMASFYLTDHWRKVRLLSAQGGSGEDQAAQEILGLGLDEIGRQVAKRWGLPAGLINTLHDVVPGPVNEPLGHADWLAAISSLSVRCADALTVRDGERQEEFSALSKGYSAMLGLDAPDLLAAMEAGKQTAVEEHAVSLRPGRGLLGHAQSASLPGEPADAALILARGFGDMRDARHRASTGQLVTMALETLYQGLGASRAIAFLHKPEQSLYAARICFGEGVQELMPRLVFDAAYQPDVFHAAMANNKIIFVGNAQDSNFVSKVPRWLKEALPMVRSFIVLPLAVDRQPIGFFYGDWDISRPAVQVEQAEIELLNELRFLIMNTIEQRREVRDHRTL